MSRITLRHSINEVLIELVINMIIHNMLKTSKPDKIKTILAAHSTLKSVFTHINYTNFTHTNAHVCADFVE